MDKWRFWEYSCSGTNVTTCLVVIYSDKYEPAPKHRRVEVDFGMSTGVSTKVRHSITYSVLYSVLFVAIKSTFNIWNKVHWLF